LERRITACFDDFIENMLSRSESAISLKILIFLKINSIQETTHKAPL